MFLTFIRRRIKLFIIALIIISAGFLLFRNSTQTKSKTAESVKVKRGNLEERLTISGTIDAQEKTTLRFQTSGRLVWVGVKEGDMVKKYQSIASLDQREVQKTLQKYLNTYKESRNSFDQTQDNNKNQIISDSIKRTLENSQADLNNAVLDVELKNLSVEFANLFTPIEGIVTRVETPYPGVNITPASAEFDVVNPQTIYFAALADQTEVTNLKEVMQGNLTLDSYPDKTLSGNIKTIAFVPTAGETGTVYTVKFLVNDDNSDYRYKIGMTGDVTFIIKRKDNVLNIPIKYIKENGGKKYVLVSINGKKGNKYVTTGMETDNDVEIVNGLTEDETVYN